MTYNVLKTFRDSLDNDKLYTKNKDTYPRDGYTPSAKRVRALLDGTNDRGVAFIIEADDAGTAHVPEEPSNVESPPADNEEDAASISAPSIDDLTKPEIKKHLDDLGVEYRERDTKDELLSKLRAELAE